MPLVQPRPMVLAAILAVCGGLPASAAEPEQGEKGERKGTVTGVVTARTKAFIEVKADGEDRPRRYTAHFPGELRGTDKATLELMKTIPIGTRVQLDWLFAERPRVMKVEVLKKGTKE